MHLITTLAITQVNNMHYIYTRCPSELCLKVTKEFPNPFEILIKKVLNNQESKR